MPRRPLIQQRASPTWRYGMALGAVVLATLAALALELLIGRGPIGPYVVAVIVVARFAGLGPGLATTILGILAATYFVVPPRFALWPIDSNDLVTLAFLALVAVVSSWITGELTAAREDERRQREWLETTLASIGDAVIATDERGRVAFLNPVAERLTGWPRAEAVGHPFGDVFRAVNERTREPAPNPLERVLRDGALVGLADDTVLVARDGTERPIDDSGAPIKDRAGRVVGAVLVFRDVTAPKRAAAERAWLANVVANSADSVIVRDLDGTILTWNPGAERLFGYSSAEMVGRAVELLIPPERAAEVAEVNARIRRGEAVDEVETVRLRKDGSRVDVAMSLSPVYDGAGRLTALCAIGRDISERRAVERMRQEFVSMLGHELRNPLASLKGYAQLMRRRGAYNERSVEVIIDQADQLERRITDLVDLSRLEAGRLTLERAPTDLVELVHSRAEQARGQSNGHAIRVDAPDTPIIGEWDRDRLGQVLGNLLSNAIKYSPDGGEILVRVEPREHDAVVSVRDQGLGIAADQLARLFSPFYRAEAGAARAGGLGLGLHITKELVEAHGGRIWVESEGAGRGSTFSFSLPLAGR